MRLYNTLTRDKLELEPGNGPVTLYVCGITTYDYAHLGHALSTITFDVLHRYLEYRGLKVLRVQNFTDVDDKIIARARREGVPSQEIANKYVEAFQADMDALNVRRADVQPRATEEIPQIISLISTLMDNGAAYEAAGSVYFRVRSDDDYGKLSRRSVDEMLEGTRFDVEPGKEFPADFALWKASKPGEPAWDSPWGSGRPGWHIECSAMVLHHIGESVDIHGGGLDLVFPHHENELAQSETATGVVPFARFWVHNGLLRLDGEKMSKSLGNLVSVRDALKEHSPDAIRLWIMGSHYRNPVLYDIDAISAQERALRRLRSAVEVESPGGGNAVDAGPLRERFIEAMDDDMNTPQAVAALFDLSREIFRGRDSGQDISEAQAALRELAGVLGLTLEAPQRQDADGGLTDDEIEALISERASLRAEKRFADADAVRDRLASAGISIADGPQGTTWSRD
ncbi:MAG: cysteine--tRNA ligase [Dehalococcoidia bacterium]